MEEQEIDVDLEPEPLYKVERILILKWRKVRVGRRSTREFLVTWRGYPLDEAQWIPEANFTYPVLLRQQLKEDRPVDDTGSTSKPPLPSYARG